MLEFLALLGEVAELSELLVNPIVVLALVVSLLGLFAFYESWGVPGVVASVVASFLFGLIFSHAMRSERLITLELKPGNSAPEEDTHSAESAESVTADHEER